MQEKEEEEREKGERRTRVSRSLQRCSALSLDLSQSETHPSVSKRRCSREKKAAKKERR